MFPLSRPVFHGCARALLGLAFLLCTSSAARADSSPPVDPCAPTEEGSRCLPARLLLSPWNQLEASGPFVAAHALDSLGRPWELRLYAVGAAGQLEYTGALAGAFSNVQLEGNTLAAGDQWDGVVLARTGPQTLPHIVARLPAADGPVLDLALLPNLLAVLRPSVSGSPNENSLTIYARNGADTLQFVREIPLSDVRSLDAHAGALYAVTGEGYQIYNTSSPQNVWVHSHVMLFAGEIKGPLQVHHTAGYDYVMALDAATSAPHCAIVKVDAARFLHAEGACPFVAGRTTFLGETAWVNRNPLPSEYDDYEVWSLANPDNPQRVNSAVERWVTAFEAGGLLVAQAHDGTLVSYAQAKDGTLQRIASTWTMEALLENATPVLANDNTVVADAGTRVGGRMLHLFDVSTPATPALTGSVVSPWLSGTQLALHGRRLLSLHRDTLTLFDVQSPAALVEQGQVALPAGETSAAWAVAGDDVVHVASARSLLVSISTTNPLTPSVLSRTDLPGQTTQMLWLPGTLYLFGPESLTLVTVAIPRAPQLVKSLPLAPGVESVALWGGAVYLQRATTIEILNARKPNEPAHVGMLTWPEGVLESMQQAGGRLFVVERERLSAQPDRFSVAVHDLDDPIAPRLVARVGPLPSAEVVVSRTRLTTAEGAVYALEEGWSFAQRLPPGNTFAPESGLSYSVLNAGGAGLAELCWEHASAHDLPALQTPDLALYGGAWRVQVSDCATGAPLELGAPIIVSVAYTNTPNAARVWAEAHLLQLGGEGWSPVAGQTNDGAGSLSGAIDPLRPWMIAGPAPADVPLPFVQGARRDEP